MLLFIDVEIIHETRQEAAHLCHTVTYEWLLLKLRSCVVYHPYSLLEPLCSRETVRTKSTLPPKHRGAVSYPLQWMTYHGAWAPWHRLWKAMKTKVSQWTVGLDRAVIQISIKVKCGLKFLKSPLS